MRVIFPIERVKEAHKSNLGLKSLLDDSVYMNQDLLLFYLLVIKGSFLLDKCFLIVNVS